MNSLLTGVCKHLSSRVCRRACALCVGVSGMTERTDVMCVLRIWGCKIPFILEPGVLRGWGLEILWGR